MSDPDQKHAVHGALALAHAAVESMAHVAVLAVQQPRPMPPGLPGPPLAPDREEAPPEPTASPATDENLRHLLDATVADVQKLCWILGIEPSQDMVQGHPGPHDKPSKYLKPDGHHTNCMAEAFGLWLDHPCTQPIQRQARERLVAKDDSKWLAHFRDILDTYRSKTAAAGFLVDLDNALAADPELRSLWDAMGEEDKVVARKAWDSRE